MIKDILLMGLLVIAGQSFSVPVVPLCDGQVTKLHHLSRSGLEVSYVCGVVSETASVECSLSLSDVKELQKKSARAKALSAVSEIKKTYMRRVSTTILIRSQEKRLETIVIQMTFKATTIIDGKESKPFTDIRIYGACKNVPEHILTLLHHAGITAKKTGVLAKTLLSLGACGVAAGLHYASGAKRREEKKRTDRRLEETSLVLKMVAESAQEAATKTGSNTKSKDDHVLKIAQMINAKNPTGRIVIPINYNAFGVCDDKVLFEKILSSGFDNTFLFVASFYDIHPAVNGASCWFPAVTYDETIMKAYHRRRVNFLFLCDPRYNDDEKKNCSVKYRINLCSKQCSPFLIEDDKGCWFHKDRTMFFDTTNLESAESQAAALTRWNDYFGLGLKI